MSKTNMLLFFVLLLCICTPLTEVPGDGEDEGPTVLILGLEELGRKTAEFSGAPIEAMIELDQDTFFSVLQWHTGQGDPLFSDSLLKKQGRDFSVLLNWKKYPLIKDSASGIYFDTVYVSIGGGLKKSNRVIVKVTNLPVVVDSTVFNGKRFSGIDSVWRYSFGDTAKMAAKYVLKFYVRDLDGKPLSLQVLTKKGTVIRQSAVISDMSYEPPTGDFTDTISFVAYDQNGSQVVKRLIISKTSVNKVPIIDSVRVRDIVLRGTATATAGFAAMDSLKLHLFAHDIDGTIKNVQWRSSNYTIKTDSTDSKNATWICTSDECSDSTADTSYFVDSILVKVIDDRGDSIKKCILLYKGMAEQPPVISQLKIGDESMKFSDGVAKVSLTGGIPYEIVVTAADPEKKELRTSWKGYPASRLTLLSDSTARYTAPTLRDIDTVTVSVSDEFATVNRLIIITIADIGPVLDSIYVRDTVFRGSETRITRSVTDGDTVLFIAYATDKDKEDSLKFQWSAGKVNRFISRLNNRAKYLLPATDLNDTITLTLQDGAVQSVKKIILFPGNRVPVLDSVTGNTKKLLVLTAMQYLDKRYASDTVGYKLFTHDPDGDSLSITWSVKDSAKLIMAEGDSASYICQDTYGKDTIDITISDNLNTALLRKIIVHTDTAETE